jgi:peptidoglycan/LPS O-acetylase OafA/YrhL
MSPNNLNITRLIGAILVLYGHSFVFLGLPEPLFMSWIHIGPLGVFIFFTISGYLITQSWERDPNVLRFFIRRTLRIFPGLAICILISVLIFGPLLTELPLKEYFKNNYTFLYFRNIALYISYYLPGVFEHNKVPNAVNGSLWSLPVEFFMYIAIAILGFLGGNRWIFGLLTIISAGISAFWAQKTSNMLVIYASDLRQVFICGTYFWVGAVFYKFDIKRYFSLSNVVIAMVIMICLESHIEAMSIASWLCIPFIVLSFGLSYSPFLNKLVKTGDYSYGIYIYAFPIQQALVYYYPNMPLMLYLSICIALHYLSLRVHGSYANSERWTSSPR